MPPRDVVPCSEAAVLFVSGRLARSVRAVNVRRNIRSGTQYWCLRIPRIAMRCLSPGADRVELVVCRNTGTRALQEAYLTNFFFSFLHLSRCSLLHRVRKTLLWRSCCCCLSERVAQHGVSLHVRRLAAVALPAETRS